MGGGLVAKVAVGVAEAVATVETVEAVATTAAVDPVPAALVVVSLAVVVGVAVALAACGPGRQVLARLNPNKMGSAAHEFC